MEFSPSQQARTAGQRLAIDAGTVEVVEALRSAGVESILFKGPALDRLYEDTLRPYGDADVLVPSEKADDAERVLAELGFERYEGEPDIPGIPWRAHPWSHARGVTVDLHRYLVGARYEAAKVWDALSKHTRRARLAGGEVDMPRDEGIAVVVALHAAQHGPRWLRPQSDLERALDLLPEATWRDAAALATEIGAEDAFAAGLRLVPKGAELAAVLGLTQNMSPDVALALEEDAGMAMSIEELARVKGLWNKVKAIAREVFPTRTFMVTWAGASGGWPLAFAYVRRPFHLLRRLPRGLRLWWRARKTSRRG